MLDSRSETRQTRHHDHIGTSGDHDHHGVGQRVVLATVAAGNTDNDPRVEEWKYTALSKGWRDVRVLGKGEPWNGFRTKTRCFQRLCKSLPADDIVVATDAFDLLICGTEEELVAKFLRTGKEVVVGAESVCGPNTPVVDALLKLPDHVSKRYVNSGFIAGRARVLSKLFCHALNSSPDDDQIGVGSFINCNPDLVHVDSMQCFVLNLNFYSEVTTKCFWHTEKKRFRFRNTASVRSTSDLTSKSLQSVPPLAPAPTETSMIEYPLAIHTPFVGRDLGLRDRYVRRHLLVNWPHYSPRSYLEHSKMALRHILLLTKNNHLYRSLTLSVILSTTGSVAATASVIKELNIYIGLALLIFGNLWYIYLVRPKNLRYFLEVFFILTGVEVLCVVFVCFALAVLDLQASRQWSSSQIEFRTLVML